MHQYGVRDVERLLGLPRSTIRALIGAGFVAPARGARNNWLFSFQDLIVLRTAQALSNANVSPRRIMKSLKELRRHLPDTMPLSGLRIGAIADRVVVREAGRQWQAESGQYLLAFEGDPEQGSLSVIEQPPARTALNDDVPFAEAVALEGDDVDAAIRAYERLLHESGRVQLAGRVYREAIAACGNDPVLWFNYGVLLDDLGGKREAIGAYEAALRADPQMADAHFNLALLYEQLKKPKDAIRHMAQYRKLTAGE
jgi:tetratricopeptide (TPR) repeat protein